jgi:hypothetical protein
MTHSISVKIDTTACEKRLCELRTAGIHIGETIEAELREIIRKSVRKA